MSEKEVAIILNFKRGLFSNIFWYEQNRASNAIFVAPSIMRAAQKRRRSHNFAQIEKLPHKEGHGRSILVDISRACFINNSKQNFKILGENYVA